MHNGSLYCSKEIIQICARVGSLLHHTPVCDGAAKGKIERFFRTVRDQFLRAAPAMDQKNGTTIGLAQHQDGVLQPIVGADASGLTGPLALLTIR